MSNSIRAMARLFAYLGALTALPAAAQQSLPFTVQEYTISQEGKPTAAQTVVDSIPFHTAPQKSGPICGGVVNGKPQGKCDPKTFPTRAGMKLVGKVVAACPTGSFPDLGHCWSCEAPYTRSTSPVDGDRACVKKKADARGVLSKSDVAKATYHGPRCKDGSFFDPINGGQCYKCPKDYQRSIAHIEADNACFIPAGEKFAKATRHENKKIAWPHQCPGGYFHDGWDGGGCWKCPSGYRRTGHHINDSQGRACVDDVAEKQAKADWVSDGKCLPGEVTDAKIPGTQDSRTGGGCWKCPASMVRTWDAVDSGSACSVERNYEFKSAKQGTYFICPEGSERHEGQCRSCPPNYLRTASKWDGPNACERGLVAWYTAPYPEPGLFGLNGADKVLENIARAHPELLRMAVARAVAKAEGADKKALEQREHAALKSNPETSTAAAAAVLARLIAVINNPATAKATPDELRLVRSFGEYITKRRTYIAQDAYDHYVNWKTTVDYYANMQGRRVEHKSRLEHFMNIGVVPPDFSASAGIGAVNSSVASLAAGTLPIVGDVLSQAISIGSAAGGVTEAGQIPMVAGRFVVETAVNEAVGKAVQLFATTTAKSLVQVPGLGGASAARLVAAASSSGPQIIIGVELMLASILLDKMIAIAEAEEKLKSALTAAKTDMTDLKYLKRVVSTSQGMAELMTYWSYAVAGSAKPQQTWVASFRPMAEKALMPPQVTSAPPESGGGVPAASGGAGTFKGMGGGAAGATAVAGPAVGWSKIVDGGRDVAIGANGKVWRLGNDQQPGGYGIYRLDGTTWTKIPGGGVQITADPQGNAWVVNDKQQILRHDGKQWVPVPGTAQAVKFGANGGLWALGTEATPGGFRILRWDGKGWVSVQGGAMKIAVDPRGNAAAIDDKGAIFAYDGAKWTPTPGTARDIAIGAQGHIWMLGTSGAGGGLGLFSWDGKTWIPGPAATGITSIAVAPDGTPWGVTSGHEVVRLAGQK